MDEALRKHWLMAEQDQRISDAIDRAQTDEPQERGWRVARSLLEQLTEDKERVGWPFGKPAHEVRVPLASVRDVDSHPVAPLQQSALQLALDAIKHLKLKAVSTDLVCTRPSLCSGDQVGIVSCDSMVEPAQKQLLHDLHEVAVHILLVGIGYVPGLLVSAFDQPDANPVLEELVNVPVAAVEVRLDDHPQHVAGSGSLAEHSQGGIDIG